MNNANENIDRDNDNAELTVAPPEAVLDAELEELLADAEGADPITAEAEELDLAELEEIDAEAHAAATRAEAYASQPADEADAANDDGETSATSTPRSRAPRVTRTSGAKPSAIVRAQLGADLLQAAMLIKGETPTEEAADSLLDKVDSLAKKVADKAINLMRYRGEPGKLQNYTRFGLEHMIANPTEPVTGASLTKVLQDKGYTVGTARSQANQLMQLFPTLGVGTLSGKSMTLNPDSAYVEQFQGAAAAA